MKSLLTHAIAAGLFLAGARLSAQPAGGPIKLEKVSDGMIVPIGDKFLKVQVWGENLVRIVCAKNPAFFTNSTPATQVRQREKTSWKLTESGNTATLATPVLQVRVDLATGAVSFLDASGRPDPRGIARRPENRARRGAGRADLSCRATMGTQRR